MCRGPACAWLCVSERLNPQEHEQQAAEKVMAIAKKARDRKDKRLTTSSSCADDSGEHQRGAAGGAGSIGGTGCRRTQTPRRSEPGPGGAFRSPGHALGPRGHWPAPSRCQVLSWHGPAPNPRSAVVAHWLLELPGFPRHLRLRARVRSAGKFEAPGPVRPDNAASLREFAFTSIPPPIAHATTRCAHPLQ